MMAQRKAEKERRNLMISQNGPNEVSRSSSANVVRTTCTARNASQDVLRKRHRPVQIAQDEEDLEQSDGSQKRRKMTEQDQDFKKTAACQQKRLQMVTEKRQEQQQKHQSLSLRTTVVGNNVANYQASSLKGDQLQKFQSLTNGW